MSGGHPPGRRGRRKEGRFGKDFALTTGVRELFRTQISVPHKQVPEGLIRISESTFPNEQTGSYTTKEDFNDSTCQGCVKEVGKRGVKHLAA